ncbi:MAG: hypothetical protein V3T53_01745 [Phycisphaerales bacterium]
MRNNDNPSDQRHAACLVLFILACLAALGGCAAEAVGVEALRKAASAGMAKRITSAPSGR